MTSGYAYPRCSPAATPRVLRVDSPRRHRGGRRRVLGLVIALASWPWCIANAQSLRIVPRHPLGKTFYIEDRIACRFSFTPGGLDDDTAMIVADVTLGVFERAEAIPGKGVRLIHTIDRVAIAFRGPPALVLRYDTDDAGAGETPASVLRKLVGRRYVVVLDVEGQVVRIRGADALRREIEPASNTLVALSPVVLALSDAQIRRRCSPGGIGLACPDGRVRVGDTWSCEMFEPLAGGGRFRARYVYRLATTDSERGRRIARVELRCTLVPGIVVRSITLWHERRMRLCDGSIEGYALFDVARGRFTHADLHMRLTLAPTPADNPTDGLRVYIAADITRRIMSRGKRVQARRRHRRP